MNVALLLNGLGSVGLFSSRIFLPALLTALFIRFGAHVPLVSHSTLLLHVSSHPVWFTSDASIAILTVLSILEFAAQRNTDARQLLHEVDVGAKGFMALLTALGVAKATDSTFVTQVMHQAGVSAHLPAMIAAVGTVGVAQVRKGALRILHEIDPDDVMRLQHLISWAEETWVLLGMIVLFFSPIIMLFLISIAIATLLLFRLYLQSVEEHTRIACTGCGQMIYPCATACCHCRMTLANPHAVGMLGQSKKFIDPDPADHAFRLIEKKRCQLCATHLKGRSPHQACRVCGTPVFADGQIEPYVHYIGHRLKTSLLFVVLFCFLPVVGLLLATIYYQFRLVNPFSGYLPFGRRFLLKWGIRILFVVLFIVQIWPAAGGIGAATMALVSFFAYRSAFRGVAHAPPEPHDAGFNPSPGAIASAT